jgi:hypothetical protein
MESEMRNRLKSRPRGLIKMLSLTVLGLGLLACQRQAGPAPAPVTLADDASQSSTTAAAAATVTAPAAVAPEDYARSTYWPDATLDIGQARISCGYDYGADGDGQVLASLGFFAVVDALTPCQETGVVRVRYEGKIGAGFTALVQRVAAIADRLEIPVRVLDIDSTGGHVEEAIRAGDSMGDARWAIWVREGSQCHSSCVLILAGGETRAIAGKVGIHRLFRDRSTANTRAELNAELREVNLQVRDYLARNGADTRIADVMMTTANRSLRLLTEAELREYGLEGRNAVQDDLDRIRITRRCGEDFARRRDAWIRAFENQCLQPGKAFEDQDSCGRGLEPTYGFPDARCPDDSPTADRRRLLRGGGSVTASAAAPGLAKDAVVVTPP